MTFLLHFRHTLAGRGTNIVLPPQGTPPHKGGGKLAVDKANTNSRTQPTVTQIIMTRTTYAEKNRSFQ